MMKLFTLAFLGVFCVLVAFGQDMIVRTLPTEVFRTITKDAKDTSTWKWKRGGAINLNLAQGSLSNWAAGGDNFSMSLNAYTNYFLYYKKGKHTWDNNLDMYFGYVQTTSLGSRKNDDRIDFLSKYGLQIDSAKKFYLSGLFSFRSQFFDGYTYNGTEGTLSSTLLSPAYVTFSLGMDYKPVTNFSVFLSPLTSRATIVASKRLAAQGLYGVPAGQRISNAVGAFTSINYSKVIGKNVTYKGRMDLFSDYSHNPWNIDLYFTNQLGFKINRYLTATYNLDMIYDDDVKLFGKDHNSPGLQVKSLLGIGFQCKLAQVAHQ
ncbi:Protein of unknown function [Filimonas lacunae]|uniref:DUF3078 domain-containing protein n=1 Tax=Filimonas lacunae TaxID=477680 RepID=A0A173MJK1_9BACT|nr:DUF3078 domain-containing protein [Filimonas lacunae]BAV07591.1 hypothetical protein FLA_3617 [Filimonas lacunae]SIT29855.1 Protein of unknown function [Filimonas lacunae]